MCGIAGFYDTRAQRSRSEDHKIAQTMTQSLLHRGPDQGGLWQDEDVPLALGHRRLSIQDLSQSGAQPMASPSGRYMMVYNGEIYNVLPLRSALEDLGVTFRGHSDTEVILAGIECWGLGQTLQKINGMFAIALWDKQARMLHFMRDRFGKKPLYIGWAGQSIVFGSELKALRAHPDYSVRINPAAAELFFHYSSIPAPYTIDEKTWQLLPGHSLSLPCDGTASSVEAGTDITALMLPYWQAGSVAQDASKLGLNKDTDQIVLNEFEAILKQSVQERMISDVPLGAFLSGGVDSSVIVALMQTQQSQPIKTYTIGFKEDGFDEAGFAHKVAAHLGTDHHELYVSEADALALIPDLPSMYDEPFADISAIPTALVSRFARQSVTVALSGDGGDEMLGGYNRHIQAPRLWGKLGGWPLPLRRALSGLIESVPSSLWDAALPFRPQAGTALHKVATLLRQKDERGVYEALCRHWQDAPMLGTAAHSAATLIDRQGDALGDASFAERMMLWDVLSYLPSDILVKGDRASMACGLELRAPLLDQRVYSYVWSLPLHYKIRGGTGKWLLRQVLERYVPSALFDRPKQGFSMPVGAWLRGDLRDWAESLLSAQALEAHGLLDKAGIRRCWQAHLDGQGAHATRLWSVLMFQAWAKKWL
jgi:asparagine synthase (glutamine-hydrolysing)